MDEPQPPAGFTTEALTDLLGRHGGNPERWPEAQRAPALALTQTDAEAGRLLAEAQALDAALDALPVPAMPPHLPRRVLDALPRDFIEIALDWLAANFWRPVGFALAPLLVGFALGNAQQEGTGDIEDAVTLLAFDEAQLFHLVDLVDLAEDGDAE